MSQDKEYPADVGEDFQVGTDRARQLATNSGGVSLQKLRQFVPVVKAIINRLGSYLPPDVSESTLLGRGILALMEAAERYSPDGPDFERLAERYIWRAIAGTLQQSPCFTAETRAALVRLETAYAQLSAQTGATDDQALAEVLEVSVDQVRKYLARIGALFAVLPAQVLAVSPGNGEPPSPLLEGWQQHIRQAITQLPQAEQLVVALYYFEDLTFPEIAEILEMDVARVQQLFGRAALLLRSHLARQLALAA